VSQLLCFTSDVLDEPIEVTARRCAPGRQSGHPAVNSIGRPAMHSQRALNIGVPGLAPAECSAKCW
jgi:hypothetical protein